MTRFANRRLLTILLLTVLAAGTRWWMMRIQDTGQKAGGLPDARSEYTLDNFDLLVMDKQGSPSFQMESPHLEKLPMDGSTRVQQPQMHLFEDGKKAAREAKSFAAVTDDTWTRAISSMPSKASGLRRPSIWRADESWARRSRCCPESGAFVSAVWFSRAPS